MYRLRVEVPILLGATVLANSKLFVSGRYHPSIMASLGGTPCIFLGSNSHKNTVVSKLSQEARKVIEIIN